MINFFYSIFKKTAESILSYKEKRNKYIINLINITLEYYYFLYPSVDSKYNKMNKKELEEYNKTQLKIINKIKKQRGLSDIEAIDYYTLNESTRFRKCWHLKKIKEYYKNLY